jgi:hypothetical protein
MPGRQTKSPRQPGTLPARLANNQYNLAAVFALNLLAFAVTFPSSSVTFDATITAAPDSGRLLSGLSNTLPPEVFRSQAYYRHILLDNLGEIARYS